MASGNELRQDRGLNCVGYKGSIVLATGLCQCIGSQGCLVQGINDCAISVVYIGGFVSVIGSPMLIFRLLSFGVSAVGG